MKGLEIRVKGKVQGVGFRPFVWQLAHKLNLNGEVLNDGEGVLIRLLQNSKIGIFQNRLTEELPPLARIDTLSTTEFIWNQAPDRFTISASHSTKMDTQIVPDAATCPDCLAELYDRENRRYRYPLINCTHCGPRFTIIRALPYDRPKTVMHDFPLCPLCETEYCHPADRRYHAQPVACEECGPMVYVEDAQGNPVYDDWLEVSVLALSHGQIVAIKSVGGFHLICDATDKETVQKLRDRKQRQSKPLATMAGDINFVHKIAHCSPLEKELLTSRIAPIVLLTKKANSILADNIAPGLAEIGVMLPSNPIQHLLATAYPNPLVMTSANSSGLPPEIDNETALTDLSQLADLFVFHNRDIVQRCDDSLMRIDNSGRTEVLRRSRGLVPDALDLPDGFPDAEGFLAYGGDLKSAFAIGKGRQIIVSQYLGDLTNIETQQQYKNTIEHYLSLYQLTIRHHVADKHPGYFSHQLVSSRHKNSDNATITYVQHHHAHAAGCLIENGWRPEEGKVLALALDGLGFDDNNEFRGGELLLADYYDYQVIGGIPAIPLTGGDQAAKEPWRAYYAHLKTFIPQLSEQELTALLPGKPVKLLDIAMHRQLNTHAVRSAGRLFDAVAASLGIAADGIEYEGEAACQLEALALQSSLPTDKKLSIPLNDLTLDLSAFWKDWLKLSDTPEQKALFFHQSLAGALAEMVIKASGQYQNHYLVLTGGVFHNTLLKTLLKEALPNRIRILEHQRYSCGDGGLALGQLAVALCKSSKTE